MTITLLLCYLHEVYSGVGLISTAAVSLTLSGSPPSNYQTSLAGRYELNE